VVVHQSNAGFSSLKPAKKANQAEEKYLISLNSHGRVRNKAIADEWPNQLIPIILYENRNNHRRAYRQHGNISVPLLWTHHNRDLENVGNRLRDNHEPCTKAFNDALRRLPEGFYTLVEHDAAYVQESWVGKRGGVRIRSRDGNPINPALQRPCLRVQIEQSFAA
jgi:hypothetical protein